MPMTPTVFVVDDDEVLRDALCMFLDTSGLRVEAHADGADFLSAYHPARPGCLLLDIDMPGMSGLEVQQAMKGRGIDLPILFLTGHGDIPMAVQALQAGALDFLEKPVAGAALLERVGRALEVDRGRRAGDAQALQARTRYARLSPRERGVMAEVVAGLSNKEIAQRLGIGHRTVETHRYHVMEKMGAGSLAELVQMAALCRE